MNENVELVPYIDDDYDFVYEVKKNAYKKYVEECWGSWEEENQKNYFEKFISTVKDNAYIIMYGDKKIGSKILKDILEENKDKNIEIQYFKQNPVGKLYDRLGFVSNGETEFHYKMIKGKTKE